jgi:transposase
VKKKTDKSSSDGYNDTMYIGMDLHKNFLQIAMMDNNGKVLKNSKIENNHKQISNFFRHVKPENTKVVIESSSVWYDTYRYLSEEKNLDVILSNPIKTKAIASAKIKTDKIDAKVLADLLRGGYIAQCYVPDRKIMELRDLVRHRAFLVRTRTKLKNKIHSILLMNGIRIDEKRHFSAGYVKKLKELHNYRIDSYLGIIESLDGTINDVSKKILKTAEEDEMARLLMTIPGVGYYSALLTSSEIGDISRFSDSHHLCAYAGLVPSIHSSGGVTYMGKITKTGSKHLRWALTECIHNHVRYQEDSNITRFYNRIATRRGKAKATIAAASKMLRVMYWMLKEKREYQHYSQGITRLKL